MAVLSITGSVSTAPRDKDPRGGDVGEEARQVVAGGGAQNMAFTTLLLTRGSNVADNDYKYVKSPPPLSFLSPNFIFFLFCFIGLFIKQRKAPPSFVFSITSRRRRHCIMEIGHPTEPSSGCVDSAGRRIPATNLGAALIICQLRAHYLIKRL